MDIQKVYRFLSASFLFLALVAGIAIHVLNIDYTVSFYGFLILSTLYSIGTTLINEIRKLNP